MLFKGLIRGQYGGLTADDSLTVHLPPTTAGSNIMKTNMDPELMPAPLPITKIFTKNGNMLVGGEAVYPNSRGEQSAIVNIEAPMESVSNLNIGLHASVAHTGHGIKP